MATKMQEAYDKAYREAKQKNDMVFLQYAMLFVGSALFGWFVVAPIATWLLS